MVWLLWPVVGAVVGYFVSSRTGLSLAKCVASGLLLGPLNAFLLFAPVEGDVRASARCSYCAQSVLTDARVCQHCGAILSTGW
jgi:hypothetical protein